MTGILLHKLWVGQEAKNNFWVGQAFLAYYCSHRPDVAKILQVDNKNLWNKEIYDDLI